VLPIAGRVPSTVKRFGVADTPDSLNGPSGVVSVNARSLNRASDASVFESAAHPSASDAGRASNLIGPARSFRVHLERDDAVGGGVGQRPQEHPRTTEKMAVVRPIPSARVSNAIVVNPRRRVSCRRDWRASATKLSAEMPCPIVHVNERIN
jgi:hypothetical protein